MSRHDLGWKQLVFQDLQWLKDHHPGGNWPKQDATLIEICQFVAQDPQWKAKVKKAEHAAIRFAQRIAKHKLWT